MSSYLPNDNLVYAPVTAGPRRWMSGQPIAYSDLDYSFEKWDFIRGLDISATDWLIVKDSSAAVAVGADAVNGTCVITSNATTDDDGGSFQSIQECYQLLSGKQAWWECKFQISDATQSELYMGLSVAFATNPEAILSSANRIGFDKVDGSTRLRATATATSVSQVLDTGYDMVAATYVTVGFHWDGSGNVNFYLNRNYVGQMTSGLPTATAMALACYHLSGDANGTKTATIDYVSFAKER